MGGYGSGRMRSKATTEGMNSVDIRWMKKQNYLQAGIAGTLSWSCRGEKTDSIGYRIESDRMILNYRSQSNAGEWETIEQIIYFDWTPCNYGGSRQWFLCPGCHQRVAVVYGGKYYRCRHCHNLCYSCQNEPPDSRLISKAQKIRKRLGASLSTLEPILFKPKGMHQKTFDRLKNEEKHTTDRAWWLMGQHLVM